LGALDETLQVRSNELTTSITEWPTSTWQSWPSRTFRLFPPTFLELSETPQHLFDPDVMGLTNLSTKLEGGDGSYHCGARKGLFMPIPRVPAMKGFTVTSSLGECGTVLDGTASHGYMVQGIPLRSSGYVRLGMIEGQALTLEWHDDAFTVGDAIELRTGRPAGFMACNDEVTAVHTSRIDADGNVEAGTNPVTVKLVTKDPTLRVLAVSFAKDYLGGISIAQIDDDGTGPARKFATTPLTTSKELGDFTYVSDVACADTSKGPKIAPLVKAN
jgi:hypothetical protein